MATKTDMTRMIETMRTEMGKIARTHGRAANLPVVAEYPGDMDIDEVAAGLGPERIGTQTVDQIRRLQTCLACAAQGVPGDTVAAESSDVSEQIGKGQAIGTEVNRMLAEAWKIDLEMRAEVDSLREQIAEGEDRELGAYVAEQKAVLLEKLVLLIFVALLLEAAKLCLLLVIQLLDVSRDLLAIAYNALVGSSAALEAAARTAIANGTIIPVGTAPALDARLALTVADNAALLAALANYRGQIPARNALVGGSNQALADALALLPRCLALQELARRLISRFLEVERALQPPAVEG